MTNIHTVTMVTGGARSGKSRFAANLADKLAMGAPVLFVATAEESDDEMRARIARHRADRPPHWVTIEAPTEPARAIADFNRATSVVLLDCLTLLTSNILMEMSEQPESAVEAAIELELTQLITVCVNQNRHLVVVTNEVGMGLHPMTPLGRLFQDVAGRTNQYMAAQAHKVVFMVSGLPLVLKGEETL